MSSTGSPPSFDGDDLVARGVQMEAWSVEDQGDGVCFNVYVYNCQPGVDHRLRHRGQLAGGGRHQPAQERGPPTSSIPGPKSSTFPPAPAPPP